MVSVVNLTAVDVGEWHCDCRDLLSQRQVVYVNKVVVNQ